MSTWEDLQRISMRFAGFSLDRRSEWKDGPWRIRILPNKTTRQDYKIVVFGVTLEDVVKKASDALDVVDDVNRFYVPPHQIVAKGSGLGDVLDGIRKGLEEREKPSS